MGAFRLALWRQAQDSHHVGRPHRWPACNQPKAAVRMAAGLKRPCFKVDLGLLTQPWSSHSLSACRWHCHCWLSCGWKAACMAWGLCQDTRCHARQERPILHARRSPLWHHPLKGWYDHTLCVPKVNIKYDAYLLGPKQYLGKYSYCYWWDLFLRKVKYMNVLIHCTITHLYPVHTMVSVLYAMYYGLFSS